MTTYLTWLPEEVSPDLDVNGVPRSTVSFRPVNAARPAEAATHAALKASPVGHPYSVSVSVMRADRLGTTTFRVNRYTVRFERIVKSVEASS